MKKTKKRIKLGTIKQELKRCRAAFKRYPKTEFVWCCHHLYLKESNYGYARRIRYIVLSKPTNEQASRLRSFRPVKSKLPIWKLTRALYNKEWPSNTWTGRRVMGT